MLFTSQKESSASEFLPLVEMLTNLQHMKMRTMMNVMILMMNMGAIMQKTIIMIYDEDDDKNEDVSIPLQTNLIKIKKSPNKYKISWEFFPVLARGCNCNSPNSYGQIRTTLPHWEGEWGGGRHQ